MPKMPSKELINQLPVIATSPSVHLPHTTTELWINIFDESFNTVLEIAGFAVIVPSVERGINQQYSFGVVAKIDSLVYVREKRRGILKLSCLFRCRIGHAEIVDPEQGRK